MCLGSFVFVFCTMGRIHNSYEDSQIKAYVAGFRASKLSYRKFAKAVGIPSSSLRRWTRNSDAQLPVRQKPHTPSPQYTHVEEELAHFVKDSRKAKRSLTNLDLRAKALEISARHGDTKFTASDGWITRFKKRNAWAYRAPPRKKKANKVDTALPS